MSTINGLGYKSAIDYAAELTSPLARTCIEVLNQSREFIQVMAATRCNRPEGHLVELRTQLPKSFQVARGGKVKSSKPGSELITFKLGIRRALQKENEEVAKAGNGGDPRVYLAKNAPTYVESLTQGVIDQLINGDPKADVNNIKGLKNWYPNLGGDLGDNVVNCGGDGSSNTSVYFLTLGEENEGVSLLLPNNGNGGISATEPRFSHEGTAEEGEADYIYRYWTWEFGFAIPNAYNVVRFANIDVPSLRDGSSALSLVETLRKAPYRIQAESKPGIFLMNKTLLEHLDRDVIRKELAGGGIQTQRSATGQIERTFNGYRIITTDAISNEEGKLVAA